MDDDHFVTRNGEKKQFLNIWYRNKDVTNLTEINRTEVEGYEHMKTPFEIICLLS